jgi:hypothetical protein
VKAWLKEVAPVKYPHNVQINYIGGDPRIAFQSIFEERCYLNGQLQSIDKVEEIGEETKINTFGADAIEEFLANNGIMPIIEQPPKPDQQQREVDL